MKTRKNSKHLSLVQVALHSVLSLTLIFNLLFTFSIDAQMRKAQQNQDDQSGLFLAECEASPEIEFGTYFKLNLGTGFLSALPTWNQSKSVQSTCLGKEPHPTFEGIPLYLIYEDFRI